MKLPVEEKKTTEKDIFEALEYEKYPELSEVKIAWNNGDTAFAKKALIRYFEKRRNVKGFFDYRKIPFEKVDLSSNPQKWQSFVGLNIDLEDYIEKAAEKMMENIYLLPGGVEIDMGNRFELLPHASQKDAQKVQQGIHIVMKRGKMFELLAVLFQRDGNPVWVEKFSGLLRAFFEQYNLTIEEFSEKSAWFQYSENRESMDVGWLLLTFINLLNTRIFYEIDTELAFEMIKRIWFFGMQFHRYDTDAFYPHNHHFFERGITPYITAKLVPEFKELRSMEQRGKKVILEHIEKDFTESGAYSEHSIGYFFGATVSEMLYRVLYVAKAEKDDFFDDKAKRKIKRIFEAACYLASPEECYPVIGDKGDIIIDEMLRMGAELSDHRMAKEVLAARQGKVTKIPLDFCSPEAGFITSRSSYQRDSSYFLMCAKQGCEMSSHDHLDMLSLNLAVRGSMIFEESAAGDIYGRFIMNKPHRGFLYNMSSHNTVLAHGEPITADRYFSSCWGVAKPDTILDVWNPEEKRVTLRAHHNGYGFCTVYRELMFWREKGFFIKDSVVLGGRDPRPHVQRWFLAKGTAYQKLGENCYLFMRGNAKLLCTWHGERLAFDFSKPEILCPEIYASKDETPWMLDVIFHMPDDAAPENKTAAVSVRMEDVSDFTQEEIERLNNKK